MVSKIVLEIRKRAGDVRQDGEYCGLFELTVWAALKELKILCSFGTSIVNVHEFCGEDLPKVQHRATIRVAAVYCTEDRMFSADKPGLVVPEANHFLAAHEQSKCSGKTATDTSVRKYKPCGGRRTAEEVAYDIGRILTNSDWFGDCLIDAFCIHANKSRNAVNWKKLRNEIGDKIEHIAAMVEKGR